MEKVLVLEDDSVQSTFLTIKLQQKNYDVTCCRTYESGINAIKNTEYLYYFIDINLGEEKNGVDFIEEIRKKTNAPIIITSDFSVKFDLHIKLCQLLGFNLHDNEQIFETKNINFFIKPINYNRLFDKMDEIDLVKNEK